MENNTELKFSLHYIPLSEPAVSCQIKVRNTVRWIGSSATGEYFTENFPVSFEVLRDDPEWPAHFEAQIWNALWTLNLGPQTCSSLQQNITSFAFRYCPGVMGLSIFAEAEVIETHRIDEEALMAEAEVIEIQRIYEEVFMAEAEVDEIQLIDEGVDIADELEDEEFANWLADLFLGTERRDFFDSLLGGEGGYHSPARNGASRSVIEKLKQQKFNRGEQDGANINLGKCTVCLEELSTTTDEKITKMPCSHLFHQLCVCRWLEEHTTCPICRYQIQD